MQQSAVDQGDRRVRADRLTELVRERLHRGRETGAPDRRVDDWLGPDLFGRRIPPKPPDFLADLDFDELDATMLAPLLRRLSLTRPAPGRDDLTSSRLRADPGPVSSHRRSLDQRQWAPRPAPLLPERTVIAHLVHAIRLGGPIPDDAEIRRTFAAAARRYAGQVDVVVWTDVSRSDCEAARGRLEELGGSSEQVNRLRRVRSMLDWAQSNGIQLICVTEVFHAGRPMSLYPQFVAELDTHLPSGYAAAAEHLRLEILARFGGGYVDSGVGFDAGGTLTEVFAAVAASGPGFTLRLRPGPIAYSEVIVAPAAHPMLLFWRELNRSGYQLSQPDTYGCVGRMAERYALGGAERQSRREPEVMRSDRAHRSLLHHCGCSRQDLVGVDQALTPGPQPFRAPAAARPSMPTEDEVITRIQGVVSATVRRLISRQGDLQLTAVAPVVAALPDPDAAWVAILRVLAEVIAAGAAPAVRSVTRFRLRDDGTPDYVGLPPQAEAMLTYGAPDPGRLGAELALPEQAVWLLDEAVVPAGLDVRPGPGTAEHGQSGDGTRSADAVELRIDAPGSSSQLPAGFVGVWLHGRRGTLWSGQHRVTPEDVARRLADLGLFGRPVGLRFAGDQDAGVQWFGERLQSLLQQPVLVRDEVPAVDVVQCAGADRGGAAMAVAERLLQDLRASLSPEVGRPNEALTAAASRWPDAALVPWLRERVHPELYRAEFEADTADRLGPDLFGLRRPRPVLDFLAETKLSSLRPELVAPLLNRLSLTRPAPTRADLSVEQLRSEPGAVTSVRRSPVRRRWGQIGGPWLPETAEIPQIVHAVWLGGPLPVHGSFRANFAAGARRYAGQLQFVLWTDVSRADAVAARRPVPAGTVDRWAGVRSMLDWAEGCGVLLVNVFEVFNAGCPMVLQGPFDVEMAKLLPRGFGAASDHLRLDIVSLFGGGYIDGDNVFEGHDVVSGDALVQSLPELFASVAESIPGFTLHPVPGLGVANDVIIAPAGHPALTLWMELVRTGYRQNQRELFGGLGRMTQHYTRHSNSLHRYTVVCRSGRRHHQTLQLLGIHGPDQAGTRPGLTAVDRSIGFGSDLTWADHPGTAFESLSVWADASVQPGTDDEDRTVGVVQRVVSTLARQLISREGNLHLTLVAPVVTRLPNPDAAWIAVLTLLTELGRAGTVPVVTSITDISEMPYRQKEIVHLPIEAEALIERSGGEELPDNAWFGAEVVAPGQSAWLLDEKTSPVRLLRNGLTDASQGQS